MATEVITVGSSTFTTYSKRVPLIMKKNEIVKKAVAAQAIGDIVTLQECQRKIMSFNRRISKIFE